MGRLVTDLEDLLNTVEVGDLGLAHFACHNSFSTQGGSTIDLHGGPFTPSLLNAAVTQRSLERRSPLVFMNACRSASASPEYTRMTGWAQQFMAAGAGAFIGTLWAVRSESAAAFAEAFYYSLVAGECLGDAILNARRSVRTNDTDPTWLAYCVYGDPAATISPEHFRS